MPSSNPLWFGYYPGDRPMNKRPPQVNPPMQIPTPDFGVNEALDEAMEFVGKPAELPGQIWEWIKDDFKQQFTVGSSPASSLAGSELYQFDRGETADVTGIYSSINLVDLVTNPGKAFTKFAENSFNAINPLAVLINGRSEFWTDLDTASQRAVWDGLIKTGGSSGKSWGFGALKDTGGPIDLIDQGIFAKGKIFSTSTGGLVDVKQATDVYKQVAENTLGFIGSKKSALFRNIAYRSFEGSVITAASTELALKEKEIDKILSANPTLATDLGGKTQAFTKIQAFTREGVLTADVSDLGAGLKKLRETVTQREFTNPVTIADLRGSLDKLDAATDNIHKQLEEIRDLYKLKGMTATAEFQAFNRGVSELERFVGDVKGFTGLYTGRPDTDVLGRGFSADSMVSQATQLQSRFANPRYGGGVQDRYLESISNRYLEGPKSLLNLDSGFVDPTDPTKPLFTGGYRSLGTVYHYHRAHYMQEAGRDLADAFLKDKLSGPYLWFGSVGEVNVFGKRVQVGLIKDRIQQFTPGYWTGQLMARTHKFGLVYDSDYENIVLHPIFDKNPLIQKHTFTEKVDYTFGGKALSVTGHFAGSKELGSFYRAWDAGGNGKLVGKVLGDGSKDWVTDIAINKTARFNLLNGKSPDIGALSGGKEYLMDFGRDWSKIPLKVAEKDWKNLTDAVKVKEMREQLARELKLTTTSGGLIEETDENFAKLDAFFKKIGQRSGNPTLLNPFQEKFGALQIYASKLSQVQQTIITKLGLQKVVKSLVNFRRLLSQKVMGFASKALSKLGVGALVAATGGLATILVPVLEKVLQTVIAKTIDKTKALLISIIKGNFEQEFSKMLDDAISATQKVLTCGCIVPIILSFSVLMLLGTVIVSISPVDRSKATSSSTSAGGTLPGPPNDTLVGSNCPLRSGTKTLLSYNPGIDNDTSNDNWRAGHGSKWYWTDSGIGFTDKYFSIPFLNSNMGFSCPGGFCSPDDNPPYDDDNPMILGGDNICSRVGRSGCDFSSSPMSQKVSWYGYAMDISGSSGVYAPSKISCFGDVAVNLWRVRGNPIQTSYGCGVILEGLGTDGRTYKLFLLHLASCPANRTEFTGGKGIASVLPSANHVHIELSVDNSLKKPEDCMCTAF